MDARKILTTPKITLCLLCCAWHISLKFNVEMNIHVSRSRPHPVKGDKSASAFMMFQCGRTNTTPKVLLFANLWFLTVVEHFIEFQIEINYRGAVGVERAKRVKSQLAIILINGPRELVDSFLSLPNRSWSFLNNFLMRRWAFRMPSNSIWSGGWDDVCRCSLAR